MVHRAGLVHGSFLQDLLGEDIFKEYWNLESDTKKKEFIKNNAIKMPMMKCKEGSRRNYSVDWAFFY